MGIAVRDTFIDGFTAKRSGRIRSAEG